MSERSCPVSHSVGSECPMGNKGARTGPRGCNFMSFTQQGDLRAAFDIPAGVDPEQYLRQRERKAINEVLYSDVPSMGKIKEIQTVKGVKSLDLLNVDEHDLLAVALGAPARQVLLRAEEVGPRTGWRDGYLSTEYGFCPPDAEEAAGALGKSPGRVWSDLCERMPGCVARGRVRESVAALPVVQGTVDVIPDKALWAALVSLGMLCSIYRYEEKHNGREGVSVSSGEQMREEEMSDELGDEVKGIPMSIGLPFYQISKRMGRSIPHLTFFDQSSYNLKVRDPTSTFPYVGRFDNTDLRWPMFGDRSEIAFLKGCADTSASFQHGVDAIATCQEHVMNRNKDGLLRELIRLKEILERMPNAFHTISMNPNSGDNYVSPAEWVRWAKFSAPLSKRCPATSGLQFPPYLLMDAFLGRSKYESFLGAEGIHLRAWLPSNWRAFTAAVEYHYRIPDFVAQSGDAQLIGALDGIVEAYTGERGFMGTHRYKVFGLLEVAGKTGRSETNGNSGSSEANARPWEETHKAFSDSMKERLEPFRGNLHVEPHQMRGTFAECRYKASIINRSFVDMDPERSIAKVTFDIQGTGITFQPGDRLAIMPLNCVTECAKVAAALGLDTMLNDLVALNPEWTRFSEHIGSVSQTSTPELTVKDVLRRGHLSPLTKDLVMKLHTMLQASSNTLLQVLATTEWPVRASLGDLLQAAVIDTSSHIWDQAFDISGNLSWLCDLVPVEVPRTYSISNYPDELLPSTIDLTVSRSEFNLSPTFSGQSSEPRHGVSSGFLNPPVTGPEEFLAPEEDILIGVSRPLSFQLPIQDAAPCAFFAGGSGIAPFRSFWQARTSANSVGRNMLFLGVQSREKFCYENELREYVREGSMEVYTAFSRDSRGLVYDRSQQDLVEKEITPRYIDTLIVEQGATVCDLVMSKKQGGLGGYLYVCGSISVFDSVMSGIRKAIYNHRTSDMESTDVLLNTAFAERRFMLDVFMTPRPLPCDVETIPLSALSMNTGHVKGGSVWIAVHGSVYDVTEFGIMHPGGVNIIKSNAGVDCSKSFDLLAHTNNPEVSSLLNKYFIAHLTPKPDFRNQEDMSMLYDLWADYLRTSVETLVAQAFEVQEFMDSSALWFQGTLFNMGGVRRFYHHQSRLLQNGFSTLFGAKLQELYLKLSFTNASSSMSSTTQLPDILGIIARAKVSKDAMTTSHEVSEIGRFTSDSGAARFHEKGILNYAQRSVELDMELLEGIREEACTGMDAFDTLSLSPSQNTSAALSLFLLQLLERIAIRLETFYIKLAEVSIYNPEIEQNPARTRWNRLQRRVRDGSFFVLTQDLRVGSGGMNERVDRTRVRPSDVVEFDHVISRIQQNIIKSQHQPPSRTPTQVPSLTDRHFARNASTSRSASRSGSRSRNDGPSAVVATQYETHQNTQALNEMITFIEGNKRAIRRLSKLPSTGVSLEELVATYGQMNNQNHSHEVMQPLHEEQHQQHIQQHQQQQSSKGSVRGGYSLFPKQQQPTPPSSRSNSSSRSTSRTGSRVQMQTHGQVQVQPQHQQPQRMRSLTMPLNHRPAGPMSSFSSSSHNGLSVMGIGANNNMVYRSQSQSHNQRGPPTPAISPPLHRPLISPSPSSFDILQGNLSLGLNKRSTSTGVVGGGLSRSGSVSVSVNGGGSVNRSLSRNGGGSERMRGRRRESLSGQALRTLVLQQHQSQSPHQRVQAPAAMVAVPTATF